jgi:hypothetical protein
MADVGKSSIRTYYSAVSPLPTTGAGSSSRGEAYYKFGSTKDGAKLVSRSVSPSSSSVTPAGNGAPTNSSSTQSAYDVIAVPDNQLTGQIRVSKPSGGLFGGTTGSAGMTQADTGPLAIPTGTSSVMHYYLMRANDPDCVTQPTYVYWVVTGSPDTTGSQYTGSRCGVHALTNIIVEATWTH